MGNAQRQRLLLDGSPHWTISATGSFKKPRKSAEFRQGFAGEHRFSRLLLALESPSCGLPKDTWGALT
jgi:hypothetical protein